MRQELKGKVAVVTGAANGIGKATAALLAAEGADIALLDVDAVGIEAGLREVRASGRRVWGEPVDCTSRDAITAAFSEIRDALGPVDILVNNVGQSARERMTRFDTADLETLDFLLLVNLKSGMYCTREVVADMKKRRSGKIVNITSDAAVMGPPGCWDYGAAKAGVIGFTRALARELAPFQVTVNAVGPGVTRTRAIDQISEEMRAALSAEIPMQKIAEPEDIANAVLFFSSDMSRHVTGQTLLVNGGKWML